MTKEPKTGDRMFELMKSDKKLMEEKYCITVGGWCADEGPDTKKGKRLMAEEFSWMIILVCWAHQINLVVGDLLGLDHKLIAVIEEALEIIKWSNGHSDPLYWLNAEQQLTYGKILIIFLPFVTCWLTHYHSTSCLLEIEESVQTIWYWKQDAIITRAGDLWKQECGSTVLQPIEDREFWRKLRK